MRVSICIGSACHLKGSREVIKKLQQLVTDNKLDGKVDLNGDFWQLPEGSLRNGGRGAVFRKAGNDGRIF